MRFIPLILLAIVGLTGCAALSATPAAAPTPGVIRPSTAQPQPLAKRTIFVVDPRNGDLVSHILVVDPDARTIQRTIPLRYTPDIGFSPDSSRLYVADSYQSRVIRGDSHDVLSLYNARTGDLLHDDVEIPKRLLYKVFPGGGFGNLVVARDGKRIFVGQYGDPDVHALRLAVVDAETLQTLGEYPYPCSGYQLLPLRDGRLVCAGSSEPVLFDPLTGKTATIATALPAVNAATVSASGERLYVVSSDARVPAFVVIADLSTSPPQILKDRAALMVPLGSQLSLSQIGLSPDERRLYVGFVSDENRGSGTVDEIVVFDVRTWQHIGVIKPSDPVWQFAVSTDGSQLYTVNPFKKSLSIFDTNSLEETGVMHDLGDTPALIVVPPQGM